MRTSALILISLVATPAFAQEGRTFYDGYADVFWSRLTGTSSFLNLRGGLRQGPNDYFVFLRNETYDTRGTDLPFQYAARGATAGAGYRYWFPGRQFFGTVTLGTGLDGANRNRSDFRAGFAGFTEWWRGEDTVTDLYADLFYVGRAEDTFLNVRVRPGKVLQRFPDGRLWTYGVGQLYASGRGLSGTENRVEAGLGIGYIFGNRFTLNAEARAGYSFRGTITNKSYFNPVIYLAGNL